MNFPENVKYSKDHEWIRIKGNEAYVGITDFAQRELGDIVYVDIDTVDQDLNEGDVFGTVEAVKTVSDLLMPVSGKVIAINEALEQTPEVVNDDPYDKGWMVKISVKDKSELDKLMDSAAYQEMVEV